MFREKINDLIEWKEKKARKPLIINGARQVGKSWLVHSFGKEHFEGKVLTINFEKRKDLHSIFKTNYDVKRIILELEIGLNTSIDLEKDLLFFDEIQACSEAMGSLRYFHEDIDQIFLIAAGSLLDFEFRNQPFPVGRVELLDLQPMSFYEFLLAREKTILAKHLRNGLQTLPETSLKFIEDEFNFYLIVGGMPECVESFIQHNDLNRVAEIQQTLLYSYEQDFKKYQPTVNGDCLNDILENSARLAGNQIIYTKLSTRFTGPTIKKGVDVLKTARLLSDVPNVSISGLPLAVSGKQFKLFHLDIGLLIRKSQLPYQSFFLKKELTAAFNGMLAEQFVAQQLLAHGKPLNYWARTSPGSNSEVDFVVVEQGHIVPIEVKAGTKGSLKSLHYLLDKNPHIQKAIVYSKSRTGIEDKIHFRLIYRAGMDFEETNLN